MTREEAITRYNAIKARGDFCEYLNKEMVEMAIQALSQEPTVQDKQAESEKYQKAFDDGYANGYAQARFDYEQEPCDDAISRAKVLEMITDFATLELYIDKHNHVTFEPLEKLIKSLPSVTQKSGHWIDREEYDADRWKCSVCGRTEQYKENYCPSCGAKMESEVNNG